jgi:pimeloyl-ACP methyl ester carboxylesterase
VALYPEFHEYFRASRRPLLAVWAKNDPFFLPAGAEAFKRDLPDADVRFADTGHFALEPTRRKSPPRSTSSSPARRGVARR